MCSKSLPTCHSTLQDRRESQPQFSLETEKNSVPATGLTENSTGTVLSWIGGIIGSHDGLPHLFNHPYSFIINYIVSKFSLVPNDQYSVSL